MNVHMPGCLVFKRSAASIGSIGRDRKVPIVFSVEELCALVIVVEAQADEFIGVDLSDIEGKLLPVEVLTVIQHVQGDWFLRTSARKAVEDEPRPQGITQIELLADSNIDAGSHQDAEVSSISAPVVDFPASCQIVSASRPVVTDALRVIVAY